MQGIDIYSILLSNMENNLIVKLLEENLVAPETREEMLVFLNQLGEETREGLLKMLSEHKEWVQLLSDNLQAKKVALAANDSAAWEKIIKEEERQLEELENRK